MAAGRGGGIVSGRHPAEGMLAFRAKTPREGFGPPSIEEIRMAFVQAAMSTTCDRGKAVLVALAGSAPRVIVSLSTIAARSGASVSTVQRHVDHLEAEGLVDVFEQGANGDWSRRPDGGSRKRSPRQLAFVLHLPDARTGRPYSTRHPADDTVVYSLPEPEADGWRSPARHAHGRESIAC